MDNEIRNVALFLREKIQNLRENNLPNPITVEAIQDGQCPNIPAELSEFYRILYTGSNNAASQRVERYIRSLADDDIYKTTHGAVKPSKHMLLGMGLKSITGSRKVQEIVNHFGHCIGYHTAEEYETQIAAKIIEKKQVLPDGLEARKWLSTISAMDNYDESMYHDTQGICLQNEVLIVSSPLATTMGPTSSEAITGESSSSGHIMPTVTTSMKKRSLEIPNQELEPVRKKLKISRCSFSRHVMDKPENYQASVARDVAWTISCITNKQTPMWSGWNSTITKDDLPAQKIGYLVYIGAPPSYTA